MRSRQRHSSSRPIAIAFALFVLSLAPIIQKVYAQTLTTVYTFQNGLGPQSLRNVGLTQGRNGILYGTSLKGGAYGYGTVFGYRISQNQIFVLHSFNVTDGANPWGGVTLATDGSFYGTTSAGGTYNAGTLYRITTTGVLTKLHDFGDSSGGCAPFSAPIEATDGNFYGVAECYPPAYPTLYRWTSAGQFTTLSTYGYVLGYEGPPLQASDGSLYVPSYSGGACIWGAIDKFALDGTMENTYSFNCNGGGAGPVPVLAEGRNGYIYGVAREEGTYNYGTIYKLNLASGQLTTLYNFGTDPNDGSYPGPDGMNLATDGNYYGVTTGISTGVGSLYELTGTETYIRISTLAGGPEKPPLQDTNGTLYGVTEFGGANYDGTIYTLDIGKGPFVTFVRAEGQPGSNAQILGQGFTGTTSVTFNGVAATSFTVVDDTFMTAVVPTGATSGPVIVTTLSGKLTSNKKFRISH